jgi:transcriptional regulator with XRE-family HTH domain
VPDVPLSSEKECEDLGTEKKIDPSTNGGKLRSARKAAKKSLADIGGYNVGYLSRVERNFLPLSTGVLASYEEAVGHSIDVTPEATATPRRARKRRERSDRAAFIAAAEQWMRGRDQKAAAPAQGRDGVAYLLGFIDAAGAFLGLEVSREERDALAGIATAVSRLAQRGQQDGTAGEIGLLVFQEHLVVQTARTLLDGSLADLDAVLVSLCECYLAYEILQRDDAPRFIVFVVDPAATQSVIFRAMHEREELWRTAARRDDIPYHAQDADLVRSWLRLASALLWPAALAEQQAALARVLPCGPYQTFRGPLVVRWNNTCCHERCPFCSFDHKPAWGFWAFLYGPGGPVVCLDCWRKGPQINALEDSPPTIAAQPGHLHALDPDDSQGYSCYCSLCGAHWTLAEGWWRRDATETWCREVQAPEAG